MGASRARDFRYDRQEDRYVCPTGKNLRQYRLAGRLAKAKPPKDGLLRYRARKSDCDGCDLKRRCCPKDAARKLLRSIHEEARDHTRSLMTSDAYGQSRVRRKKIETLFGEGKAQSGPDTAPITGAFGRQRRVPVDRHRAEPQTPRQPRRNTASSAHECLTITQKPKIQLPGTKKNVPASRRGDRKMFDPTNSGNRNRVHGQVLQQPQPVTDKWIGT